MISERCGKDSNNNEGNVKENIKDTWHFLILVQIKASSDIIVFLLTTFYLILLVFFLLNSTSTSKVTTNQHTDSTTYKLKLRLFSKDYNILDFDKFSYLLNSN